MSAEAADGESNGWAIVRGELIGVHQTERKVQEFPRRVQTTAKRVLGLEDKSW